MENFAMEYNNIINMDLCATNSWWWFSCTQKTFVKVFLSLLFLVYKMVWHFKAYIGFVLVVLLIVATLINYGRRIRTLQREVGLNQTQSQATTVLINGLNNHQVSASTCNKPGTSKSLSKKSAPKALHKAKQPTTRSSTSNTDNTSEEEANSRLSRASLQTRKHFEMDKNRRKSVGVNSKLSPVELNQTWSRTKGSRLTRKHSVDFEERPTIILNSDTDVEPFEVRLQNNQSSSTPASTSTQPPLMTSPLIPIDRLLVNLVQAAINKTTPITYPPPIKFNRNLNVNDWIREMDLYIQLSNIRDKKKVFYWAYLDSETQKLLGGVDFDEDDDEIAVDQLKFNLKELFGKIRKQPLEHMKAFHSRTQSFNENVRIYCLDLKRLALKAFPHSINLEEVIIEQFTIGVINEKLQFHLRTQKPRNVEEMLETSTSFENAHMTMKKNREALSPRPPSSSYSFNTTMTSNNTRPTTSYQARASQPLVGQYDVNRQQRPNSFQINTPQKASQDIRKCFKCNAVDHIKADCPQLKANSSLIVQPPIQINHV